MYGMFSWATSFNAGHLCVDTSSVTNMERMFEGATSFNTNISAWDTSSVTSMEYMFHGASAFNAHLGMGHEIRDEHAAHV